MGQTKVAMRRRLRMDYGTHYYDKDYGWSKDVPGPPTS